MGYIPQHALSNLKQYSYKGVDKYVLNLTQKPVVSLMTCQIPVVKVYPEPVLECVRQTLAVVSSSQHSKGQRVCVDDTII
jgi:ethanolaminephosphotransferase